MLRCGILGHILSSQRDKISCVVVLTDTVSLATNDCLDVMIYPREKTRELDVTGR